MDKIVALAKRRGFIYQSSEIYGGIAGFWDYGPLGVELKRNIKNEWWKHMIQEREDIVGLDASIIMNPKVWEASGHTQSFSDPLIECKVCHKRFRSDKEDEMREHVKSHTGKADNNAIEEFKKTNFTQPRNFNLLTEVYLGITEPKDRAYLRGEITQGVFVNFRNVLDSTRVRIPFGIAQVGKAFRNEITPGNFTFRSREFEQMEVEYFIKPEEDEGEKTFNYWKDERKKWYENLGIHSKNLRFREHLPEERAHYAKFAVDIEYNAPFGWSEFEGIHHRGDWDLGRHALKYKDEVTGEEYTPWVIETSGGVDRAALFILLDAYAEEDKRVVLRLHPRIAPYKVAVFPLLANKPDLVNHALRVHELLKHAYMTAWDDRGNIGKRYLAQDEIGTPWCVTIDFDTLRDDTVTVRDRDTMKQERIPIQKLSEYFGKLLGKNV